MAEGGAHIRTLRGAGMRRVIDSVEPPPMVPPSKLAMVAGVCLAIAIIGLLWTYHLDTGTP